MAAGRDGKRRTVVCMYNQTMSRKKYAAASRSIAGRIARRHRLTAIFFALLLMALLIPWLVIFDRSQPVPPSRPVPVQAVIVPQGVEVTWQAAQPGMYPIGGYAIQKREAHLTFTQIGQVGKESRSFIDPLGKVGDEYRIITQDTQAPFQTSSPSNVLIAKAAQAGSNVTSSTSDKPGYTPPTATTPAGKAEQLLRSLGDALKQYQPAIASKDDTVIQATLTLVQQYQQATLDIYGTLTTAQKQPFIQLCASYDQELHANIPLLPEGLRSEGQLIVAACSAMNGGTI